MKLLANLDDVNPLEYGGLLVIEDDDGSHHIAVWDEPDTESGDGEDATITIYRVNIEKFTYVDGILSDNPYHPDHPVWFADKLEAVAAYNDCQIGRLLRLFKSGNPVDRAMGYQAVAHYYGWREFDQDPLTMSVGAAAWRYRKFELGDIPERYKLLDSIRQFCQGRIESINAASPAEDEYFLGYRGGEIYALEGVIYELNRIEGSWK